VDRRTARQIKSVADARYYAEKRLPRLVRDYVRAGTGARITREANVSAFDQVTFRPRVARWSPERSLSTTVLGHQISLPVMIAPTGGGRLVHPDGERGGARAAGQAGTIQCVSTFAGTPIEEVVADATGDIFFQLYYPGGRDAAEPLIERVKAAGCAGLILTVDSASPVHAEIPAKGRVTIWQSGDFRRPPIEYVRIARIFARHPGWTSRFLADRGQGFRAAMVTDHGKVASLLRGSEILTRQTPVWEDLPWIRDRWSGPLIVKGILTVEDAQCAVEHGADAIVVSNHGGNMLDGDPATISVLAEIVDAVGDRLEIYLDGGIRRGSDVVKALALGARAVLIGRPWLWGLAAAGSAGVLAVLEALRTEIHDTVGGLGCSDVRALDRSFVNIPAQWTERGGTSERARS
jgi:isopentenyl diphosphate isomerase/L-lactate dehydrogenase-like FMN-dependent dehydrogenase